MSELQRIVDELRNATRRSFGELPDKADCFYAVWVDDAGAAELSLAAPEPIRPGIIYAGECVKQSVRRHLAHRQIGQLTLMMSLAATFRKPWSLKAVNGVRLEEPGQTRLREWMAQHLTATVARRRPDVLPERLFAALDPPLRIQGGLVKTNELRTFLTRQRAELVR